MEKNLPKILIVCRSTWNDNSGTSSTLSNVFGNYDPQKLAHIYIETKEPQTRLCNSFFQISEYSLIKKCFRWNTKTGRVITTDLRQDKKSVINSPIAKKEQNIMNYVRGHRSLFFTFLRDILWSLNGWKSRELEQYIKDFNPDIIWFDASPLILMNRLAYYVYGVAGKPMAVYEVDDVYTYKSCSPGLLHKTYKYCLRKYVKRIIKKSSKLFVISRKMKREYDRIFGLDSVILTKGIDFSRIHFEQSEIHSPIRLVYLGQVIYGRIYSLIALAQAISKINENGTKMILSVYTNNEISEDLRAQLVIPGTSELKSAVPYDQVSNVISENDVLVFTESFEPKCKNTARLSFSTKITDYLASGKCILAIGPEDIAPIEYLKEEDAAIVVSEISELNGALSLLSAPQVLSDYSRKAFECGMKNHNMDDIHELVHNTLNEIINKKS